MDGSDESLFKKMYGIYVNLWKTIGFSGMMMLIYLFHVDIKYTSCPYEEK